METNSVEILKAKEKYQNDIKQAYNELLKSANNIIEEFELEVDDYGIFSCIQDTYREQWQTIKNNIKSSKDYDKMIQAYKEMQNFIQKVSTEYKKEDDDMWEKEFDFIIPKNIKDPTITKKYENVDEVLEEVFEDSAIESESKDSLFLPQIFNYNDMTDEFKNDDLIVSLDKLSESRFFQSLFNAINQPMFSVLNAYKKAKTTPAFLSNQEKVINERIKNIVTKRFNELFGKNDKNGYDFEIRLEEHRISFAAYKINGEGVTDRDVLILEQQSTGFKWFFNLYFNLLNGKILKSGDIVLMDEPAHNLSPKARKECAEFLRKYGEENGITFVIVTHDLFWIDSDFLNEVRIIKNREDKEAKRR